MRRRAESAERTAMSHERLRCQSHTMHTVGLHTGYFSLTCLFLLGGLGRIECIDYCDRCARAVACYSVSPSVTRLRPAKTAKWIDVPLGRWRRKKEH